MKFVPERFTKIYLNWMENVRDWCISRQLWWGHQIPVWYCGECGHMTVSRTDPSVCEKCGGANITRDPDVLDTWFSSALWPFSVYGWPDKTPDLDFFYPTAVVCPGYEIIFFWVARMIFSGMEHMGDVPFRTAYIHGMVRDDLGRKMSKSLGNGVDPQEAINQYGADALRMNMISGTSPGNDMRFYTEKCESMRNFANKLWNASRFVMMNLTIEHNELPDKFELEDKWILSKFNTLAGEVCENLDKYELGVAASKIYDFIWDVFCDWYIELAKPRLGRVASLSGNSEFGTRSSELNNSQVAENNSECSTEPGENIDANGAVNTQKVLLYVLTEILTLLHPFMPFITEEIWQALPKEADAALPALMVRKYPKFTDKLNFPNEETGFESIMAAVRVVRAHRAELRVPPSKKPHLIIATGKPDVFEAGRAYLGRLAYAGELTITQDPPDDLTGLVSIATSGARLYMPLAELVDVAKERKRLEKEIARVNGEIERLEQKLQNEQFTSKAPSQVIEAERAKLDKAQALQSNLVENLKQL